MCLVESDWAREKMDELKQPPLVAEPDPRWQTVDQILEHWRRLQDKWRHFAVTDEQSDAKQSVAERLRNDELSMDLASMYTPTTGFKEEAVQLNKEAGEALQHTLEFLETKTGYRSLHLAARRDAWAELSEVMLEFWTDHAYDWFHSRQKKTIPVTMPVRSRPLDDDNKVATSAAAAASVPAGTVPDSATHAQVFVTTSLGSLFLVVISFIHAHIHQVIPDTDAALLNRVVHSKSAEQVLDELGSAWNHLEATVTARANTSRHVKLLNKSYSVFVHWLWSVMGSDSGDDVTRATSAESTDHSIQLALTKVVDMDPDYVGVGVRGLRPVNEAALTLWYMRLATDLVYEHHLIVPYSEVPEGAMDRRGWTAWHAFLEKHLQYETTSAQNLLVRKLALFRKARVGARGVYADRENQGERTVEAVVCVQHIHPGDGLEWVKQSKVRIKEVFAVLDNPECHELRPFAALMFVDRTFRSYFDTEFIQEFVVFEWDLYRDRRRLFHKRSGTARRRPLILFVLGRFWVQLVSHPDCNSNLPILIACPNSESAILLWSYMVVTQHQGTLPSGADISHSAELPFIAAYNDHRDR